MAWSTREIAELAGTSLRTVRHYHDVGLLPEPARRPNGYKQYGVAHLVRVLRVKRLSELGFSLTQIAEMGEGDEHPQEALHALDAELSATITRLQRARVELGFLLRESTAPDLPPELAIAALDAELSDADRSLLVVLSRVLGQQAMEAFTRMLQDTAEDPTRAEFEHLPDDADEETRQALAERMAPITRDLVERHPKLREIGLEPPHGGPFAAQTVERAIKDLYRPAQLDVLRRLEKEIERTNPLHSAEADAARPAPKAIPEAPPR
ncbi:helix-turn-helix domain-containing protein [Amycolatopsis panacis]|uniref:MerR family transcriptional regulator n=1 Tax=Amycolatopsis panacis TaxID=2340917 RepID=A0A419IBI1_9PSEU|nr:MerR family transcriptional regulator [Amycolatopsis panacis]RJQ92342.1 MerR family transcriptional regulator [Amycolatopsis panacis]